MKPQCQPVNVFMPQSTDYEAHAFLKALRWCIFRKFQLSYPRAIDNLLPSVAVSSQLTLVNKYITPSRRTHDTLRCWCKATQCTLMEFDVPLHRQTARTDTFTTSYIQDTFSTYVFIWMTELIFYFPYTCVESNKIKVAVISVQNLSVSFLFNYCSSLLLT